MDFVKAMDGIVPSSQRSASMSPARPLPAYLLPLLAVLLAQAKAGTAVLFPPLAAAMERAKKNTASKKEEEKKKKQTETKTKTKAPALSSSSSVWHLSGTFAASAVRPRLLVSGGVGNGQRPLGRALLHALEEFPVFAVSLPSLLANSSDTANDVGGGGASVLVAKFAAARRAAPSVVYLPDVDSWCVNGRRDEFEDEEYAPPSSQYDPRHELLSTLLALLEDTDPGAAVLVLATAEVEAAALPSSLRRALTCGFAPCGGNSVAATATAMTTSAPTAPAVANGAVYEERGVLARRVAQVGRCDLYPPGAAARAAFIDSLVEGVKASAAAILALRTADYDSNCSASQTDDGSGDGASDVAAVADEEEEKEVLEVVESEQPPRQEPHMLLPSLDPVVSSSSSSTVYFTNGSGSGGGGASEDPKTARQRLKDEHALRELRICLSSVLHELQRDKRYTSFWRPVDPEEVPDYYAVSSTKITCTLSIYRDHLGSV